MLHITCLLYRIKRTKVLVNLVNLIRLRMFKLNVFDDLKCGKYNCCDFESTLNRHAQGSEDGLPLPGQDITVYSLNNMKYKFKFVEQMSIIF